MFPSQSSMSSTGLGPQDAVDGALSSVSSPLQDYSQTALRNDGGPPSKLVLLDGQPMSVAVLRRMTELEIELKQEKAKNRALERQLHELAASEQRRAEKKTVPAMMLDGASSVASRGTVSLASRLRACQQELDDTRAHVKHLTSQLQSLEAAFEAAEKRHSAKVLDLSERLHQKQDEIDVLTARLESFEQQQGSEVARQAEELETELRTLRKARRDLDHERDILRGERTLLTAKQEELAFKTKDIDLRFASLQSQKAHLDEAAARLHDERRELRSARLKLEEDTDRLERLQEELLASSETLKVQQERLASELATPLPPRPLAIDQTVGVHLEAEGGRKQPAALADLKKQLETALAVQDVLRKQLETAQKIQATTGSRPPKPDGSSRRLACDSVSQRNSFSPPSEALVKIEDSTAGTAAPEPPSPRTKRRRRKKDSEVSVVEDNEKGIATAGAIPTTSFEGGPKAGGDAASTSSPRLRSKATMETLMTSRSGRSASTRHTSKTNTPTT